MHLSCLRIVSCVCLVALAMTLSGGSRAAAATSGRVHHMARRSFFDLQCKGVYDASMFAELDRVCDDCYNLFRQAEVYSLCRKDCFTTKYFKGCVEVLQETDQLEVYKEFIIKIHGAEAN